MFTAHGQSSNIFNMYQFRKDVQFMCGFAGYYGAGDFNREEVIDQMGERIAHRGPDSKGSFVDDYVALGFRRLSINMSLFSTEKFTTIRKSVKN